MASKPSLDLRRQAGQLMIVGFEGTEVSSALRARLETIRPGGVILFRRNIAEAAQTHALLREIQTILPVPLFRCVDMEGGTVDRFRDVVARVPSVADVAAPGSVKLFHKHGKLIGQELRALGFNTDFAPCLDLRLEPSKSVLTSRTVSADPMQTVHYARQFLSGLREAGILGCGKHFPGLGEANLDSHEGLPVINKPWKQLWAEDLVPYREMRRQLPMVMVGHIANPQVTRDMTPASLSKKWTTAILRTKIGYRGLIASDDLDMGGVLERVSIEDAAVGSLLAGADLLLVCQKEDSVARAYEAVVRRSERDPQFVRMVVERARRVTAFKKRSVELKRRMAPAPTQKTLDRLRRGIWELTEELRMRSLVAPEERPL